MSQTIYRGQVWQYEPPVEEDKHHARGCIQHGSRPVIIVSNNLGNKFSPTALVVPCTAQLKKKKNLPTHALIMVNGRPSIALAEQATPVNVVDLKYKRGNLDQNDMTKVDHIISVAFGLCPVPGKCVPQQEPPHSKQIDKFYHRYPQCDPHNPQAVEVVASKRNKWDDDRKARFVSDCGVLTERAVCEKYGICKKTMDRYFNQFTLEVQRMH